VLRQISRPKRTRQKLCAAQTAAAAMRDDLI
jgi:hypothetical protein